MSKMAIALSDEIERGPVPSDLRISSRETNWGVVVTEVRSDRKTLAAAETILRSSGILITLTGGALPVIASSVLQSGPAFPAIGLAAACAFIGYSVHRYASTGFRSELRIDVRFGWVFIGTVNSDDDFTPKRSIQRHDVESLFIERTRSGTARLCLRLKKKSRRVVLMAGPENELVAPLKRTFETLFSDKGNRRRARTRATGDIIQASFA